MPGDGVARFLFVDAVTGDFPRGLLEKEVLAVVIVVFEVQIDLVQTLKARVIEVADYSGSGCECCDAGTVRGRSS